MKKIILSLTGMGVVLTLIFASCQKEDIDKQLSKQDKSFVNDNNSNETKIDIGSMFVTHWNGVDDCVKPAKDCLPEFIVTPNLAQIIGAVNDNQNDYDFEKIKQLAIRFKSDFRAVFGNQITLDLKNKNCKIYAKISSNKSFLIVSDLKDKVTLSVRPFIN